MMPKATTVNQSEAVFGLCRGCDQKGNEIMRDHCLESSFNHQKLVKYQVKQAIKQKQMEEEMPPPHGFERNGKKVGLKLVIEGHNVFFYSMGVPEDSRHAI